MGPLMPVYTCTACNMLPSSAAPAQVVRSNSQPHVSVQSVRMAWEFGPNPVSGRFCVEVQDCAKFTPGL